MTVPSKQSKSQKPELNIGQMAKKSTEAQSEINVGEVAQKTTSPPEILAPGVFASLMNRASIEREESPAEQRHRLWRETIENVALILMKVAGFVVLILALAQSAEILKDGTADSNTKKLAENTVVLIVGAVAGFSIGKGQKK